MFNFTNVRVKEEHKISEVEKFYLAEVIDDNGIVYEIFINSDELKCKDFFNNRIKD